MDEKPSPTDNPITGMYISTMENLLKVVQELSAARHLHTVMDIVRHSVRDLTGSDGATFVLRDNDHCYYAEEDAITPLWKGKRFPMEICISGWVMLNRTPAIIPDIFLDSRIPIDVYKETFVRGLAMIPIKTKDPIGAIGCYWAKQHHATPEQIRVLQVLADTAAIAMDNIRHQDVIAVKAKQLEDAINDTLMAVAKMVEQKDLYTSGHQKRVAIISMAVAQALGWSEERRQLLYQAGVVHDIGKIGVPSQFLAKPAKLTPQEYAFIKTHPETGYAILKDIPLLVPIAEIILQHHERCDGSGYPRGLREQEILPEAQVLCVADVFESMTSHRPYRPALGVDMALEELTAHRGVLYAARIVDALVHLVRDQNFELPAL